MSCCFKNNRLGRGFVVFVDSYSDSLGFEDIKIIKDIEYFVKRHSVGV